VAVADAPFATLPFALRSYPDRAAWLESEAVLGQDLRYLAELGLAERTAAQAQLSGVCWFCRRRADFAYAPVAPGELPNWREQLACNGCGLISRVRLGLLLACAALERTGPAAVPYVTEQVTPAYGALAARYPRAIGSEYVPDEAAAERLRQYMEQCAAGSGGTLRHENVTVLTLADRSVDAVLSFEVLEHVPDYRAALREFARVLRPGGSIVLSVPFLSTQQATTVRATVEPDGTVRHLLEPEYHGDPAASDSCLAYYNFSWDFLDELRAAGFADAGLVDAWSPASAFLGAGGIMTARRA